MPFDTMHQGHATSSFFSTKIHGLNYEKTLNLRGILQCVWETLFKKYQSHETLGTNEELSQISRD